MIDDGFDSGKQQQQQQQQQFRHGGAGELHRPLAGVRIVARPPRHPDLLPPREEARRRRGQRSEASSGGEVRDRHGGDGSGGDLADFEFCRVSDRPVAMLPADELFSDGKLLPLHLAAVRTSSPAPADSAAAAAAAAARCRMAEIEASVYSPKAPSCSSRWRELLAMKRFQIRSPSELQNASPPPPKGSGYRHLKQIVHRRPRFSSIGIPLLRDSDSDTVSNSSSRMSLSSSSSSSGGHDHEDLPRLSLDLERSTVPPSISLRRNPPRLRLSQATTAEAAKHQWESPRMSASGKVVFHGLERSSSSPGSFHGGENSHHHRPATERSNVVRVSPVLNVPVCSSLRRSSSKAASSAFGLGQLFSPQKTRERDGSSNLRAAAAKIRSSAPPR